MNCIIIDDDATARLIVRQFVENTDGFSVTNDFSNAIDAIKHLNSNSVDCVFLDIHMPDFSGFDFIKTIRNSVKVVLITSDKNFALDAFEYDSVVVKNSAEQILKIYKPESTGKNIYNIDEYWLSSEPYKRGFRYEYEIYDEDLE